MFMAGGARETAEDVVEVERVANKGTGQTQFFSQVGAGQATKVL